MKNSFPAIITYSIGHFYIDFICSFILSVLIFRNPSDIAQVGILIALYNIIAFGTQPFFGFAIDQNRKTKSGAIAGILISTFGAIFFFNPIIAVIFLGLGNALFHVCGGIVALNLEPSKAKYPGIYVAPGAVGLFLGGLLGYYKIEPLIFILSGLILSIFLIVAINKTEIPKIKKYKEKKPDMIGIVALLLLVSVCMRSLISDSLHLSWKSVFVLGLTLTIAIASGKLFGGILADKYGFMRVGIMGLLIAAPLLVFFQSFPVLVFIGVFCFNMVMPITLTAVAEAFPNYKGFAFGLTTLALALGYLSFLILKNYVVVGHIFTTIVIFINLGSLYIGLKKYEEMIA